MNDHIQHGQPVHGSRDTRGQVRNMQIEGIRAQIEEAKVIEQQSGVLRRAVVNLASQNGASVSGLQVEQVVDFVTEYIEYAPVLIEIVEDAAIRSGALPGVQPLLDAIEDFFLEPEDIIPDHYGLVGLLDDAYLTHILLQAISDEYESQSGKPLLPKEAGETNRFIRRLIGEPFVSLLDEHVSKALNTLAGAQNISQMVAVFAQMELSLAPYPIRESARVAEITHVHI